MTQRRNAIVILLEWLEAPIPAGVHSKSLLPLLDGCAAQIREHAFWGRFGEARHVSDGEWEAFFWPTDAPYRDRLYRVAVDPAEATDRSDTDPDELRRLRDSAQAWRRDLGGPDLHHRPFVRDHV